MIFEFPLPHERFGLTRVQYEEHIKTLPCETQDLFRIMDRELYRMAYEAHKLPEEQFEELRNACAKRALASANARIAELEARNQFLAHELLNTTRNLKYFAHGPDEPRRG